MLTNRLLALILALTTLLLAPAADARQLHVHKDAGRPGSQVHINTPKGVDSLRFIRTELFFGTERPDAPPVGEGEWKQFLDEEITPRFPDGLTVLTGYGQFLNSAGRIEQETSRVVILLYPEEDRKDKSKKIEELRGRYKDLFHQESVLRVDDSRVVMVSF